jgi:hypothetical protein
MLLRIGPEITSRFSTTSFPRRRETSTPGKTGFPLRGNDRDRPCHCFREVISGLFLRSSTLRCGQESSNGSRCLACSPSQPVEGIALCAIVKNGEFRSQEVDDAGFQVPQPLPEQIAEFLTQPSENSLASFVDCGNSIMPKSAAMCRGSSPSTADRQNDCQLRLSDSSRMISRARRLSSDRSWLVDSSSSTGVSAGKSRSWCCASVPPLA